jgi:ATP-binding cassette subfamily A (ABC1) protein 3
VNTQLNLTSQDVMALYPQFIYESILKTATNDSDFTFAVTTQPFPVFYVFKQREQAGNAIDFAFMVGIGLSLIPTVIVSFILKEREDNLKHMQLISGMNKCGYWLSNSIADIVKAYLPIFCIIGLTFIFNTSYDGVWVLYLLFPPAIVMFSYTFTFFFTSETSAQIIIFCINFLIGGVLSVMVLALQTIPSTAHLGGILRWWFCLIPCYCVTHGIIISSSLDLITAA